jgi:hypothetical protein
LGTKRRIFKLAKAKVRMLNKRVKIKTYIFKLALILGAFSSFGMASAGETILNFKKFMIIGFEYGNHDVPCPMRGTWKECYYKPELTHSDRRMVWKWEVSKGNRVKIEVTIKEKDELSRLHIVKDLNNWSNRLYDQKQRKKISTERTLLHFDRNVMPVPEAELPGDVEIEKHVLGRRGNEDVCLVIYRSSNLDDLKKSFMLTEWQSWSFVDHGWFSSNN